MVATVSRSQPKHKAHARAPVVVGVDGRGRSTSAVVWAAEEAQRTASPLLVVTAREDAPTDGGAEHHGLVGLARRLTMSDVAFHAEVGDPADALLATAAGEEAAMLVVGRRSLAAGQRVVTGSTSRAVAGRSPVPVVVVPEPWIQPTMSTAPIVVGVESADLGTGELNDPARDDSVLAFAFDRASQIRVPLIVVSAWEIPTLYSWSPADVAEWRGRQDEALERQLAPWRQRHPDLEAVTRCIAEPAAQALLEAGRVAQLTVVGRHRRSHLGALPLGGTTRRVLRGAERPVAVVPSVTDPGGSARRGPRDSDSVKEA
jgi:nucleotide-binding universal stress UspA family protein